MNTKNLFLAGVLIFGLYMIFFNKRSKPRPKVADTNTEEKQGGCGCGKNKQPPQVAPEL
tara:strand:+ start:3965 stop:4141 length:177 start_codon:yes stop_codon:yes gene_type:complete